jgi:Omp85 superfamily domain
MGTPLTSSRLCGESLCAWALVFGLSWPSATASAQGTSAFDQGESTGSGQPVGLLPEPRFLTEGIDYVARRTGDPSARKSGLFPELGNMVTGAGWAAAGLGYRQWLFGERLVTEASAAYSWRGYRMAQARGELTSLAGGRVAIGSQVRWQDLMQLTFYGEGPDSLDADRSEYRLQSANIVGYAVVNPIERLSFTGRVGWLTRPALLEPAGHFRRGNPSVSAVFSEDRVFGLPLQPAYVHGEASVTLDTRDQRGHPSRGGVYRTAWHRYVDRDAGTFRFDRFEGEAAHFIPVRDRRLVLALHGWLVGSRTSNGHVVPFYLEPGFGGGNTLRGENDYRFHDRSLLLLSTEARLALLAHVDLAAFVDAGSVAPRVAGLDLTRRSYGVGLRVHTQRTTIARLEAAHGSGGWRIFFSRRDPLQLPRLSRRTAAVPFVP